VTGPVVVSLPAEIDMTNAESTVDQLRSAFTPGVTVVIADMSSTVFCDSAGLRHLLLADDWAAAHHAQLWLVVVPGEVLRVLELMGLDRQLSLYPSLAAALAGHPPA
jgi:anti-sigma B factor antagonist